MAVDQWDRDVDRWTETLKEVATIVDVQLEPWQLQAAARMFAMADRRERNKVTHTFGAMTAGPMVTREMLGRIPGGMA